VSEVEGQEARSGAPAGRPRDDLLFIGIVASVMAIFLTFNAMNVFHEHARSGHRLLLWESPVWEGSSGLYFLAVTPLILAVVRRFWPIDRPRLPRLALHLGAAVVISLGHVLAIGAMRWSVYRLLHNHYDALGPLGDWPYELRKDLLIYGSIASLYVGWRLLRATPETSDAASVDVLEVRDGPRRHFVPLSEVVWVEAAGNYVELHRGGGGLLHRASLAEMERRLQSAGFVRIHRSRLVRRDAVAAVESRPTGDFTVRLRDGGELAGSRRYRRPLLAD
jgi:hypothetical protein